jgi:hypothetical protein
VWVVAEHAGGQPGFELQRDYDTSTAVPQGDGIVSAMPDWSGRIWFVSKQGVVGTIDPATGAVKSLDTTEPIGNSFAVDETGAVYIVTDAALYRFAAGLDGTPQATWRAPYPNDGTSKPGQTEVGSGTTPTVMSGGCVAITDNADPIDIVVFRKDTGALVCTQPVFSKGASDTDQSLNVAGNGIVVENNYGYSGPAATELGGTTSPGLARVDLTFSHKKAKKHRKNHHRRKATKQKRKHKKKKKRVKRKVTGCRLAWTSNERAPSVVPKLSLTNGLVYTYTKPPRSDGADPWYFTALDFRTGATVYKRLSGVGLGFNNNYAPVTLGPDGAAYVGVLGGVTRFSDGP